MPRLNDFVVNVVFAGLGGQGVLKASDILADAAFAAGFDVKKSELHGMSQRGGSVASDVRYGHNVLSPMIPGGAADYLVVLTPDQVDTNRDRLSSGGVLLVADIIDESALASKKSINVAMVGALSRYLADEDGAAIPDDAWETAIRANLPERFHDMNLDAFRIGRESADKNRNAQ